MPTQTIMLILLTGGMLLLIAAVTHFSGQGSLDNIKSKTVGDGQHGTARWADKREIAQTYKHVPFNVGEWRSGKNLPKQQELIDHITADTGNTLRFHLKNGLELTGHYERSAR